MKNLKRLTKGNLVRLFNGEIIEVETIEQETVNGKYLAIDIYPIKLNHEWLTNLRAVHLSEDKPLYVFHHEYATKRLLVIEDGSGKEPVYCVFNNCQNYAGKISFLKMVTSVHELQNIFAIIRDEDLTIETIDNLDVTFEVVSEQTDVILFDDNGTGVDAIIKHVSNDGETILIDANESFKELAQAMKTSEIIKTEAKEDGDGVTVEFKDGRLFSIDGEKISEQTDAITKILTDK